jgi:hypothetical protein
MSNRTDASVSCAIDQEKQLSRSDVPLREPTIGDQKTSIFGLKTEVLEPQNVQISKMRSADSHPRLANVNVL